MKIIKVISCMFLVGGKKKDMNFKHSSKSCRFQQGHIFNNFEKTEVDEKIDFVRTTGLEVNDR